MMGSPRSHRGRLGIGVAACLCAVALAACGGSSSGSSSGGTTTPAGGPTTDTASTAAPSGSSSATTTTAPTAGVKTGHLGDTLSVTDEGGDTATVTFVKVIDPATSTSAASPTADAGNRWVAFEATIVDNGENAGSDSASALATGSDGKQYSINTNIAGQVSGCTQNLSAAKPNESATLCPGFMIPTDVTVTQVGYSVAGSEAGQPSELMWTVP